MPAIDKPSGGSSRAWEALKPPLSPWIIDAVSSAMGFKRMTPVQASTIPLFMGNKDVVVEAVTGSGKTFAFLIPIVERILRLAEPLKEHHVASIIVSPTRELTTQTYSVLQSLLAFHGPSAAAMNALDEDEQSGGDEDEEKTEMYPVSTLKVVPQLVVGGSTTPARDLTFFLKNSPNVLIATPGRLMELLASPKIRLPQSSFEMLVLDEADRLLDLGFKEDLQKLLSRLPKQRRTGLFSASVTEAVDEIVRVGLRNPVKIAVRVKGQGGETEQRTPTSLQMSHLILPPSHKIPAIAHILRSMQPQPTKTILYFSTCAAVDYFQHVLPSLLHQDASAHMAEPITLIPLHGKHPPNVRQKNYTRFSNAVTPAVLLTTDLAARGLDIPQVDLVLQLDPPCDPAAFLHRCGRAGRAGRVGLSILLLSPGAEEDYVPFLAVRKTPVAPLTEPPIRVSDAEAAAATATIRKLVLEDRALHDKAQRAFVSGVRAYTKHQARAIFRVGALDWDELARAWGLLRMPYMPERRHWEGDGLLGLGVTWHEYAYRDPQREKQRRGAAASKTEGPTGRKGNGEPKAWSRKEEQKMERDRKRESRSAKREGKRKARMTPEERQQEEELQELIHKAKRQRMVEQEEFEGFDD